jgi:hypothetical protein
VVDALEAVLNRGARPQRAEGAPERVLLGRGLQHGNVAACLAAMSQSGVTAALGEPCRQRDIVTGLTAARVCHPASKIAQAAWWGDTTLGADLGLGGVAKDEVYAAMDWLRDRAPDVEEALACRYLDDPGATPPSWCSTT